MEEQAINPMNGGEGGDSYFFEGGGSGAALELTSLPPKKKGFEINAKTISSSKPHRRAVQGAGEADADCAVEQGRARIVRCDRFSSPAFATGRCGVFDRVRAGDVQCLRAGQKERRSINLIMGKSVTCRRDVGSQIENHNAKSGAARHGWPKASKRFSVLLRSGSRR